MLLLKEAAGGQITLLLLKEAPGGPSESRRRLRALPGSAPLTSELARKRRRLWRPGRIGRDYPIDSDQNSASDLIFIIDRMGIHFIWPPISERVGPKNAILVSLKLTYPQ